MQSHFLRVSSEFENFPLFKTSHHYQYNHKPKPSTSLPIRLLTLMSIVHYVNRQIGRGVESLLKRWLFLHRNHCLDRNININFLHWNYIFLFSERSITEIASLPWLYFGKANSIASQSKVTIEGRTQVYNKRNYISV